MACPVQRSSGVQGVAAAAALLLGQWAAMAHRSRFADAEEGLSRLAVQVACDHGAATVHLCAAPAGSDVHPSDCAICAGGAGRFADAVPIGALDAVCPSSLRVSLLPLILPSRSPRLSPEPRGPPLA